MARLHTFSQHFLRSPRLVAELIGHSNIRKNDTVYDLGAGSGTITGVLARRCKNVIAVEIEPQALVKLRKNTATVENITIVAQDILSLTLPETPYKIFANIPFSISAQVVRKFTETAHPPKSMYLITQKQFARKLVPGHDHFTSQLSAELGPWFTIRIRKPLRRTDFTPPPAVDTVLVEIKPRESPLVAREQADAYRQFIAQCFTSQTYFLKLKKPFSSELRPSQLTLEQWQGLYNMNKK
jgi:23S rRNA (adenine-N6)-dimethyltransferase